MEYFITQVPSWIVTAMIGLVGIGIGWGFLKSEITHLKEEQKNQKIEITGIDTHCETFRGQCQVGMKDKLDEIKLSLNKTRDTTTNQFNEIKEFMGYVKRVVEEVNGRPK